MIRAAYWVLPWLAVAPALAQPAVVRLGTHGTYGRVVFEFGQSQEFSLVRSGNAVVLRFPGAGDVPDGVGVARNVVAVTGGGDMATLTTSPVTRVKALKLGNRVVVDVFDQAATKAATSSRSAAESAAPHIGPSSFHDRAEPPVIALPVITATAVPALPEEQPKPVKPPAPLATPEVAPVPGAVAPTSLALATTHTPATSGVVGASLLLPFDTSVGAAAFQQGEEVWLIFDDRRPIDVRVPGTDQVFAGAAVELLPSATLIRLKAPELRRLRLDRRPEGWMVHVSDDDRAGPAQMPSFSPSRLLFAASLPGHVVAVPNRATGRNLLVGTLRAFGPGVPVTMRAPEFTVLPSWQGFVVEPVSDRVVMRPLPQGFSIETGGALSPSLESGSPMADAAALTRRFDFPADPVATLLRRLQVQTQDAGQAPAQSRLTLRKASAQTMLALGLGVEAQSLLRLAISEEPRAAADPELNGLAGIAALVSGRPAEASGLDVPGLSGTDDVTLWRAVRTAMTDGKSPEAAQAFSATVGLVLSYPSPLQTRLLPLAAETMVAGDASAAVDTLLAKLPAEPLLAYARATRMEQTGDTASALTLYDALASGRDRLASARAATRAVLLRLSTGAITPGEAADLLTRSFGKWRGDARERELRLTTADIQAQAGRWRDALDTLRGTAQLFGDDAPAIHARAAAIVNDMLQGPGADNIKPLDLVALAEENANVIAKASPAGLAPLLAEKLAALELPDRAGPVIQQMITASSDRVNRAGLGARLAAMRLGSGDIGGAAAVLSATNSPDLPSALTEERILLQARLAVARHDVAGATAILAQTDTMSAEQLRATILGDDGDWRGAALALGRLAGKIVPETGPLTAEQQDFVLRLASAEARAGDDVALRKLGRENASRITGARADLFSLLTSAPVTAAADLRRSGQELAMIHDLPTAMATIGRR